MKEKSVLVSIRVKPELYKEVKKKAIDRDDTVTDVVKRAFEKYVEEGKKMSKDVMSFEEFKEEYSESAVKLVEQYRKNPTMYFAKTMFHELEPGSFVAAVWKENKWSDTIHYEEYWELNSIDELNENCVPDVHIEITF